VLLVLFNQEVAEVTGTGAYAITIGASGTATFGEEQVSFGGGGGGGYPPRLTPQPITGVGQAFIIFGASGVGEVGVAGRGSAHVFIQAHGTGLMDRDAMDDRDLEEMLELLFLVEDAA
jgi:hypothetical protein